MSRLERRHGGRRILLPILILRPDATDLTAVSVTALLDTGANVSGIVRRIAGELDLEPTGKRPLISARGEIQVERYLFRVGLARGVTGDGPSFPYVFEETLGFELGDSSVFGDGSASMQYSDGYPSSVRFRDDPYRDMPAKLWLTDPPAASSVHASFNGTTGNPS